MWNFYTKKTAATPLFREGLNKFNRITLLTDSPYFTYWKWKLAPYGVQLQFFSRGGTQLKALKEKEAKSNERLQHPQSVQLNSQKRAQYSEVPVPFVNSLVS
jgi:hypothetical protein